MKVYIKHAAYVQDVPQDIIKDIMMIGLYKLPANEPFLKIDAIMVPIKNINEFIEEYPSMEEYLRARYRIIHTYLNQCLIEISNKKCDIEHVFFMIKYDYDNKK